MISYYACYVTISSMHDRKVMLPAAGVLPSLSNGSCVAAETLYGSGRDNTEQLCDLRIDCNYCHLMIHSILPPSSLHICFHNSAKQKWWRNIMWYNYSWFELIIDKEVFSRHSRVSFLDLRGKNELYDIYGHDHKDQGHFG